MSDTKLILIIKPDALGAEVKNQEIVYDSASTIAAVKSVLRQKLGIPPEVQDLRFGDDQLDDSKTLVFYGIGPGETLLLRLHSGVFDYDLARISLVSGLEGTDGAGTKCAHIAPGTGIRQVIRNLASGSCLLGFEASGNVTYTVTFRADDGDSVRVIEGTVGLQPGMVNTEVIVDDEMQSAATLMTSYEVQCDAPVGTRSVILDFSNESDRGVLLDQVTFRGRTRPNDSGSIVGEDSSLPSTS